MKNIRTARRKLLQISSLLVLALPAACDLIDPAERGHRVVLESGADSRILILPVMPTPAAAPACPVGSGVGREEVLGAEGGTIRLDPPVVTRRLGVRALPDPAASNAPFSIIEIPVSHPEVEVSAPAGRAIGITMSLRGCSYQGQLGIFRWSGDGWNRMEGLTIPEDSLVTIQLESASRYAVATF